MDCLYINLKRDAQRREFLEKNFAECCNAPGWTLTRVPAVGINEIPNAIPRGIRREAVACNQSHKKAVGQSLDYSGHCLILEDDACFGRSSCQVIDSIMSDLDEQSWDIVYTDAAVPDPFQMVRLLLRRRKLYTGSTAIKRFELLDASWVKGFAGVSAYIVNKHFKHDLLKHVDQPTATYVAYDVYLRRLIYAGTIRAKLIFPFATSLSSLADQSTVQPVDKDSYTALIWNSYRRLVWMERDIESAMQQLEAIPTAYYDPESAAIGKIMSAMLSLNYVSR